MTGKKFNNEEEFMKALADEHTKELVEEYKGYTEEELKAEDTTKIDQWFEDFLDEEYPESDQEASAEDEKVVTMLQPKRKAGFFRRSQSFSRVAVIALVILLAGAIGVGLSTEAIRLRVFNLFTESTEEYTDIDIGEDTDIYGEIISGWTGGYYLSLIPEGYTLVDAIEVNQKKDMTFSFQDEFMIFSQNGNKTGLRLDTEDSETESVVIEGQSGLYSHKDGLHHLVWIGSDGTYFSIMATGIEKDDLISIAESRKKIK